MNEGQILAEKYRLIEQLSRGGMGSVWRAEHIELGTPAAVKLIDPSLADTEEAVFRFRREAQSAASLRSANIVQIFDYGVAHGVPYIAMELLRGKSLARHLAQVSRLTPVETAIILSQVGKAVAWAHSMGVIHRDLKPDNIFLADDAGETVVKLLDFGIAKTLDVRLTEPPTTVTGAMMGTPFYMSPEQTSGQKLVDFRSDIWAFAVIAFECLTGQRPFQSETLGSLVLAICSEPIPKPSSVTNVPPGFDDWFAHAASRDLQKRFPSIREAAKELRRICAAGLDDEALGLSSDGGDSTRSGREPQVDLSTSTVQMVELPGSLYTMSAATPATKRSLPHKRRGTGLVLGLLVLAGVGGTLLLTGKQTPLPPTQLAEPAAPAPSTTALASPLPQSPLATAATDAKLVGPVVELVNSAANSGVHPTGNRGVAAGVAAGTPAPSNALGSRHNAVATNKSRVQPASSGPIDAGVSRGPMQQHKPAASAETPGPDLDKLVGF